MTIDRLESRYFERMARSIGRKSKLIDLAKPGTVLDAGAGGPGLSLAFEAAGHSVIALDESRDALKRLREAGLETVEGSIEELAAIFPPCSFANIVFSSVLHEVFSYASGDKLAAHRKALRDAYSLLQPGGRILIRDGVRTPKPEAAAELTAFNAHDAKLIEDYLSKSLLVPAYVNLEAVGPRRWRGEAASAFEVLHTINWGAASQERERQELFGVHSLEGFAQELEGVGFVEVASFLEEHDYSRYLEDRAHVRVAGETVWQKPVGLWIADKELEHG